jgi:DNA-binding LacI/PurR family transcriptional regulator
LPVIGSDNRQGGRLAAEHLIASERKRLLFLGDAQHPEVAGRLDGVREVLAASEAALAGVVPCAFSMEAGAAATQQSLDDGMRFDAVIAVSDFIAAGACDALMAAGIAVPKQVAIVGFDDTPIAAAHRPSLTSLRQDAVAAGRAMGQAILALLDGDDGVPVTTTLPVELIVRESSG